MKRGEIFMLEFFLILLVLALVSVWVNAKIPVWKGSFGEKQVIALLKKLDPENNILFNDLYVPKKDGTTAQIDHILVSNKGLFVIETKNFDGWIFGSENSPHWTQVLYKRKNRFYNPVWQNSTHIKVLKEYLGKAVENIPIYSIIVFGNQAAFKFKEPFTKAMVIKRRELLSVIKNTPGDDSVSHSQRQKIRQLLSRLDIEDQKERKRQAKKHVADIKKNLESKENLIAINKCPRSGGELIIRQGRNGKFKGCSNYPKCRFTANI